jgi:Na+-driven multidrug efflux pump
VGALVVVVSMVLTWLFLDWLGRWLGDDDDSAL